VLRPQASCLSAVLGMNPAPRKETKLAMINVNELKAVDVFSAFSDNQLQELVKITKRRTYRTNAPIYKQGQPATELFIIRKGLVSLRGLKSEDKIWVAFDLCEPGDLFGTASLMKSRVYTLTAVCLEETEVLAIDADKLSNLLHIDFELGYMFMNKVAQLYFDRYEAATKELGFPVAASKAAP